MAKHTPRPWTLKTDDDGVSQLIGSGTVFIAELYNIDYPAASKDAALIAAAPDLLEALKRVIDSPFEPDKWRINVEVAIAKALGE